MIRRLLSLAWSYQLWFAFYFQCSLLHHYLFICARAVIVLGYTSALLLRNWEPNPGWSAVCSGKGTIMFEGCLFAISPTTSSGLLLSLLYVLFLSISVSLSSCLLFLGTAALGCVSDLFLRCWGLSVYKLCLFSFGLITEIIWGDPYGAANWTMMGDSVLAFGASHAFKLEDPKTTHFQKASHVFGSLEFQF